MSVSPWYIDHRFPDPCQSTDRTQLCYPCQCHSRSASVQRLVLLAINIVLDFNNLTLLIFGSLYLAIDIKLLYCIFGNSSAKTKSANTSYCAWNVTPVFRDCDYHNNHSVLLSDEKASFEKIANHRNHDRTKKTRISTTKNKTFLFSVWEILIL
jgi:hypothetical protein